MAGIKFNLYAFQFLILLHQPLTISPADGGVGGRHGGSHGHVGSYRRGNSFL
jgi:hypothetical protein